MKAYNFLLYMFYANISLTLVIICLLSIRKLFSKWMSAKHKYFLWSILIIKLIIPFTFNLDGCKFNLLNLFSKSLVIKSNTAMNKIDTVYNSIQLIDNAKDYSISVNDSNIYVIIIFWLLICGIILGSIIVNNFRFKNRIINRGDEPDYRLKVIIETCKKDLKMTNKNVNTIVVKNICCAFVVGPLKPYIIISKDLCKIFNDQEIKYILLHEMVHLKRKDIIVNFITIIFCCIYWFNPLIWIARATLINDMELSCDEKVLSVLNDEKVQGYGRTIIKVLEVISLKRHNAIVLSINGTKKNVKNRIKNIAMFSKESMRYKFFGFLLFIVTLLITTTFFSISNPLGEGKFKNINSNVEYVDLSQEFNGDKGTFVLFNKVKNEYTIFNKEGSERRVSPCSTYKIALSLIGLDNGIISKDDNVIKWDGQNYHFTEWNKDQTLESAMKYSVNWYFDKIDSSINRGKIYGYMNLFNYGNQKAWKIDREYWNQSSLKISAIEQVQFLKSIWEYDVDLKKEDIDFVKDSIKLMEESGTTLYGKTGSGSENDKGVNGWFVGVVENENNHYYFATNIEGRNNINGEKAKRVSLDILKKYNVI
ncbi:BlaR1 family beta-lactam sensor/signal transducer [Clostridium butyricum]